MNRKLLLVFISAVFWLIITAFQPSTAEKALLWRIENNQTGRHSYVFGTIHIIEQEKYYFPEYMESRFDSCNVLVTEVLIDIPLKEQLEMAQRIMLPDNKTYREYLSDSSYARLKAYVVDSLSIKEKRFETYTRIKPAFFPGLVLNELLEKPTAYEKELTKAAKKLDFALFGLETIHEQLDVLELISNEELFEYLSEAELDLITEYDLLLSRFLDQDINGLYDFVKEDTTINSFEADLLTKRNKKWIPKLDSLMKNNTCFIAVGAGHLPGEDGLLNLLRKTGYNVEAIKDF